MGGVDGTNVKGEYEVNVTFIHETKITYGGTHCHELIITSS